MNTYLLVLHRYSTQSCLRLHIDANSVSDAFRFAKNIVNDDSWMISYFDICFCPQEPYNEVMGARVWCYAYNNRVDYVVLFPGHIEAVTLDTDPDSTFENVKKIIGELLCV